MLKNTRMSEVLIATDMSLNCKVLIYTRHMNGDCL
jgi:hypothetical protein